MQKIILPKHLKEKPRNEILDFLANKVQYHYVMGDHYKLARQVYESGTGYYFEDDPECEELFKKAAVK